MPSVEWCTYSLKSFRTGPDAGACGFNFVAVIPIPLMMIDDCEILAPSVCQSPKWTWYDMPIRFFWLGDISCTPAVTCRKSTRDRNIRYLCGDEEIWIFVTWCNTFIGYRRFQCSNFSKILATRIAVWDRNYFSSKTRDGGISTANGLISLDCGCQGPEFPPVRYWSTSDITARYVSPDLRVERTDLAYLASRFRKSRFRLVLASPLRLAWELVIS